MNWANHYKKIEPARLLCHLSPRQREVLELIADGQTTAEIAEALKITSHGVDYHRAVLMARLDCHDIPGLVKHAIRMGVADFNSHRIKA